MSTPQEIAYKLRERSRDCYSTTLGMQMRSDYEDAAALIDSQSARIAVLERLVRDGLEDLREDNLGTVFDWKKDARAALAQKGAQ